jgi:hypothetical protein
MAASRIPDFDSLDSKRYLMLYLSIQEAKIASSVLTYSMSIALATPKVKE